MSLEANTALVRRRPVELISRWATRDRLGSCRQVGAA
jgi:hypothetical protein